MVLKMIQKRFNIQKKILLFFLENISIHTLGIRPNVCIVEDVNIGNNVTIGAGSVVTKSILDNATAVGNYAKVINYNNPGRYINNRWENVQI